MTTIIQINGTDEQNSLKRPAIGYTCQIFSVGPRACAVIESACVCLCVFVRSARCVRIRLYASACVREYVYGERITRVRNAYVCAVHREFIIIKIMQYNICIQ